MKLNINWRIPFTFKVRYEFAGITNFIVKHIKNPKEKLVILDVGCSTGVAIKHVQNSLRQENIQSHTIGIDISKCVKNKASKNLDEFINKDVLDIDDLTEKADIVICGKATLPIMKDKRSQIFKKCCSFLKDDGVLITDAPNSLNTLGQFLVIPPPKNGLYEKIKHKAIILITEKMIRCSKTECQEYAEKFLSD